MVLFLKIYSIICMCLCLCVQMFMEARAKDNGDYELCDMGAGKNSGTPQDQSSVAQSSVFTTEPPLQPQMLIFICLLLLLFIC